jgi:adenylate cyclase
VKLDVRALMYGAPATARSLVTQRFRDPDLERAFQVEASRQFRDQATNTILLGAATWAVTAILLVVVFPLSPARIVATIAVVELLIFMVYGLLPRARTWDHVQAASATINLIGGLAIIGIGGYDIDKPYLVAPALLVNLMFAFGISRFGPIGVIVTLPYVVLFSGLALTGALPGVGPFEVFLVMVAFLVASLGGYLLEATTRGIFFQRRVIETQAEALAAEKERSERLIADMLPQTIAARLMDGRHVADRVESASVIFADLVGFTELSSRMTADAVVTLLDELFGVFDRLAEARGIEKIKTIGDAYMAVAGVIEPAPDHAQRAVALGLEMIDAVRDLATSTGLPLQVRVGVSSGPLVAGVIGCTRYSYDLWGDTVNVASRMESQGVPGTVQVSASTAVQLGPEFSLTRVGPVEVKGKGLMETFLVNADLVEQPASAPQLDRTDVTAKPTVSVAVLRATDAALIHERTGGIASEPGYGPRVDRQAGVPRRVRQGRTAVVGKRAEAGRHADQVR